MSALGWVTDMLVAMLRKRFKRMGGWLMAACGMVACIAIEIFLTMRDMWLAARGEYDPDC